MLPLPSFLNEALDRYFLGDYGGTMKWHQAQYPGIRYREHGTRKIKNGQADRYFSMRYRVAGKRIEEALGWTSEGWNAEKAHGVLARIKENVRTGLGPRTLAELRKQAAAAHQEDTRAAHKAAIEAMTLDRFFLDYYIPRAQREKRSWVTDRNRYAKLIGPQFGHMCLTEITPEDLQEFVNELADSGAAPATVKHYLAIIRRAFNVATETRREGAALFSGQNPAQGVRLPAVRNSRERFLSGDEADLLTSAAKTLTSPDLHDAIVLSLYTGLRLGELRRLTWLEIDFTSAMVTVMDEAQRKPGGKVPLNDVALDILRGRKAKATGPAGLVFPPLWGENLRENLSHEFRRLVNRVGLNEGLEQNDRQRRVVFHTLRHTFASWLALAGVDIYRIKTLMRHKTLAMTMRYAHLIPDATRDAVHKLVPPRAG